MPWLKLSPFPVGRRGVISSFKFCLPVFGTGGGGGGSAPCGTNLINAEVCSEVVILVGKSLDPALQVADLGQQAVDLFTLPAGLVHLQVINNNVR